MTQGRALTRRDACPGSFLLSYIPKSRQVVTSCLGSQGVSEQAPVADGGRVIEIRSLVCKRGRNQALRDVNLDVVEGELVFVTGPSGAGKSTLLGIIHGDLRATAGEVKIVGRQLHRRRRSDLARVRREVGIVYQDYRLLPRLTALENVVFAVRVTDLRLHPSEAVRRARGRLEAVGLLDKVDAYPGQLSGGEQQRLAIARALAVRPRVLLADEPTKNLDGRNVAQVISLLTKIARSGTTVIIATHDQAVIRRGADQLVQLDKGQLASAEEPSLAIEEADGAEPAAERIPELAMAVPHGSCSRCGEPLPKLSIVEAGSRPDGERWCPGCRAWVLAVSKPIPSPARSSWLAR
jgi:cell division transport system ATP-binding protein